MTKTLFTLLITLCCVTSFAQTQQGIVKTPTRRNVNGTWIKGQYLSNATVGILFTKNNAKQSYVSGEQGKFSFSAQSPYSVTSVVANKGTYTFLDADFSKKQWKYSANPIEILVDDPDVLANVREEAIAYERKKIKNQIRAKEDEIEALKEANKINTAEYNKMLGELSEYRQSSEAIVQQIAEVYATTDFDKLDEFNQQLLAFVEEGDFARADSLLKTQDSKEELFKKIKDTDEAIKITEEHTQKVKELNNKEKEALSQRLYSEHLMWLQKPMMQDSALYCLKMRADLDTTYFKAAWDYAYLCDNQKKYDESERYYNMCKNIIYNNNDTVPYKYYSDLANIHSNIAKIYVEQRNNFKIAEKEFFKSLELRYKSLKHNNFRSDKWNIVRTHSNLGVMYLLQGKYNLAKQQFDEAMRISDSFSIFDENEQISMFDAIMGYVQYYTIQGRYSDTDSLLQTALNISQQLAQKNAEKYQISYAYALSVKGLISACQKNKYLVDEYVQESINISQKCIERNPYANSIDCANILLLAGKANFIMDRYDETERLFLDALKMYRQLNKRHSNSYNIELITCLQYLGLVCVLQEKSELADKYYFEAADICNQLHETNCDTNNTIVLNNINIDPFVSYFIKQGIDLQNKGEFDSAEKNFFNALTFLRNKTQYYPIQDVVFYNDLLVKTMSLLGQLYNVQDKYDLAEKYLSEASILYSQLAEKDPDSYNDDMALNYYNLAKSCFNQDKWDLAEKYHLDELNLNQKLAEKDPDSYNDDLVFNYYNLANCCFIQDKWDLAEKYLLEELNLYQMLAEGDSVKCDYVLLTKSYYWLAKSCTLQDKYDYAELYFQKSLYFCKYLLEKDPESWNECSSDIHNSLGDIYMHQEKYDLAEKSYRESIILSPNSTTITPDAYIANRYNIKAYEFVYNSDFTNAHYCIDKAIALYPIDVNFYYSKGELYLMQCKNTEALEMWKKVMELNPNFIDDYPDGTNLSNGLKKLGLIK